MAKSFASPAQVSDWLKGEALGQHSRGFGTLAAGQGVVVTGTPLGRLAASGQYVVAAAAGADGSEVAVACLVAGFDGSLAVDTSGSEQRVGILVRDADVSHGGLAYGPTLDTAAKRAATNAQLGAVGIVVREAVPTSENDEREVGADG